MDQSTTSAPGIEAGHTGLRAVVRGPERSYVAHSGKTEIRAAIHGSVR